MSSYHYGKPGKQDWAHVADVFAAHESLNSKKTSSLPLVQFWQNDDGFQTRVNDLQSKLGDVGIMASESMLCFEYGVSVPKGSGRGKASMTDLMIITPGHVIAIEAKYTEYLKSKYEPLCKWLKDPKTDALSKNKLNVLAGWLKYIVDFGGIDNLPDIKDFAQKDEVKKVPYQLIHRIASACAVAKEGKKRKKAIVVYQLFYDHKQENQKKMDAFSDKLYKAVCALGIKDTVKFYVIGVEAKYERGNEKPERLSDLFLEMQEKPVYSFGSTVLLKPNQTANN